MSFNLFDRKGKNLIKPRLVGICPKEDSVVDSKIQLGETLTCYYSMLIPTGSTPVTYRLETGYDSAKHESKYTWFTTKR